MVQHKAKTRRGSLKGGASGPADPAQNPVLIGRIRLFLVTGSASDTNLWDQRVQGQAGEWTALMRMAVAGDTAAYHRLLRAIAPVLRAMTQRGLARAGQSTDSSEDVVQEILLAVHLKRHTWDPAAPFGPWLFAIARNKLIDSLRRQGKRIFVDIDDLAETLPAEPDKEALNAREVDQHLAQLPERQRAVVRSIAVDSASIKETAQKLTMSEGAVRVALHRGLSGLAARLRKE